MSPPRTPGRAAFASIAAFLMLCLPAAPGRAATVPSAEFTYVTMSDGVRIAVAVSYPPGVAGHRVPSLLMMDGYEGGADALDPAAYGNHYVMVHASIRGTGCSGGRFDLFDRRSAEDGYEIIEDWMVRQPWSNARVGIIGHSYPGLTGFLVAETAPPHLRVLAVSGLIDDLYRGITYIGGVPDAGFALAWPTVLRPASEHTGNLPRYASSLESGDPTCAANIATRPPPQVLDDPVLNGVVTREDGEWWAAHSLATYESAVRVPTWIAQQYQDEQTGPRGGAVLWERLPRGVPKRLVLTNGVHATNDLDVTRGDRVAWLDCWLIDRGRGCSGDTADPRRRVHVMFETTGSGNRPDLDHANPPLVSSDFPLPETRWTRLYLRGSNLSPTPPDAKTKRTYVSPPQGRDGYVSSSGLADSFGQRVEAPVERAFTAGYGPVTSSGGPDEVRYDMGFARDTAIAGPAEVTLWATSTAPDADLFVQLVDVGPDGARSYLQRGMLRASFRAVDPARADRIRTGPHRGEIYRPYHPFTNPALLTPGTAYRFDIEIFPVGHVFRAGHRLEVQISAPPFMDELYAYTSAQPPSAVTILSGPGHASSILLPVLPALPPLGAAPKCGQQTGVRCVRPLS